ncbi:MAG: zeta toxin family protein [Gammaproteobacteria bacterium]|nr:zeta toxin family protein [Gammaproteobacteria bacterium]
MMKQLILMMGGPASGKSYIRGRMFGEMMAIDSDTIKREHPDYDERVPSMEIHSWSSSLASQRAEDAIESGESFVFDGTGSTAEKYVKLIKRAHRAGYRTRLVYVACDLQTALERNRERSRTVPEAIVIEKHASIADSFEIVSRYAQDVQVVNNQ